VQAYYTQVDKAQDALKEVFGTVVPGSAPKNAVIVLIDELDRCDPDEAFNVIKQMRVLFAMRSLPVAFVVCANPEPIGLAIKHRYGLESDAGDYEARRILEKFVDSYEELSESVGLGALVSAMWKDAKSVSLPWILKIDSQNQNPDYAADVIQNATGFDAINSSVHLYSNLRVLQKSFQYVHDRIETNRHLLWTIWHLAIAEQLDPKFRRDLRFLADEIREITLASYSDLCDEVIIESLADGKKLRFGSRDGQTLFAIFRTKFWEHTRGRLKDLRKTVVPEWQERAPALQAILIDPLRMDFLILLCMLPFQTAPSFKHLDTGAGLGSIKDELKQGLSDQFGWALANA
jgi:hypothetical protein